MILILIMTDDFKPDKYLLENYQFKLNPILKKTLNEVARTQLPAIDKLVIAAYAILQELLIFHFKPTEVYNAFNNLIQSLNIADSSQVSRSGLSLRKEFKKVYEVQTEECFFFIKQEWVTKKFSELNDKIEDTAINLHIRLCHAVYYTTGQKGLYAATLRMSVKDANLMKTRIYRMKDETCSRVEERVFLRQGFSFLDEKGVVKYCQGLKKLIKSEIAFHQF